MRAATRADLYQTHGVGNSDFLRVVGKDGSGAFLPAGPMLAYEQLPDSNPIKKVAKDYITQYEAKFGPRTTFGGLRLGLVPRARQGGSGRAQVWRAAGTKEFRAALRNALENTKEVVGVHGVFNMSADRAQRPRQPRPHDVHDPDGKWALATK